MNLHQRLSELRDERALRLREVAEASGLSVPYISHLEHGHATPRIETLECLAAAYGITLQDLLTGVDGYGTRTDAAVPTPLRELLADPIHGPLVTPDWQRALARIDYRGRRPRTSEEYLTLFLSLRRILK